MVAGHTHCLVDGHFGLVKQKYHGLDGASLAQLASNESFAATAHVANGNKVC